MIERRTARLRFLRRQEWIQSLPFFIGQVASVSHGDKYTGLVRSLHTDPRFAGDRIGAAKGGWALGMQANIVGLMKSQRMALILFVDDDHYTLQTLSKAAQVLGHRAVVADSCQGALVIAQEQSPDLIITDMRLTDANGLNLVQQLKSQDRTAEIPVVVL